MKFILKDQRLRIKFYVIITNNVKTRNDILATISQP